MEKQQIPDKIKFSLPPFEIQPFVGMLDFGQRFCWTITAFDLPEMWELTKGEGVKIALLDTGVDFNHEDLKNSLLPGFNAINPEKLPFDDCRGGHGTFCCGIICALDNNIGVIGIAPKAKVIPIKVLDSEGCGDVDTICKGIDFAIDSGADMISMSFGSSEPVEEIHEKVKKCYDKNLPVFVSSGNANLKKLFYPAGYSETISVSSVGKDFKKSSFSNVATNLDLFSPGHDILSTTPNNNYSIMSGTSMSAPFACSIAALMLSYSRSHKTDLDLSSIEDWKKSLKRYTTPVNDESFKGFGIIDPREFVKWVENSKTSLK